MHARPRRTDDGEPLETDGANWDPALPPAPNDFPEKATFALTRPEARYLREHIMSRLRGSLLLFLADQGRPADPVAFLWEHPQAGEFPKPIQDILTQARNFSETIHGAALLYNYLLAQKAMKAELIEGYQQALQDWAQRIMEHYDKYKAWPFQNFWKVAAGGRTNISQATRLFVQEWLTMALNPAIVTHIVDHAPARELIANRERRLKGNLARLENQHALELWTGQAGTAQLDFRWSVAQVLLADIHAGLQA